MTNPTIRCIYSCRVYLHPPASDVLVGLCLSSLADLCPQVVMDIATFLTSKTCQICEVRLSMRKFAVSLEIPSDTTNIGGS